MGFNGHSLGIGVSGPWAMGPIWGTGPRAWDPYLGPILPLYGHVLGLYIPYMGPIWGMGPGAHTPYRAHIGYVQAQYMAV